MWRIAAAVLVACLAVVPAHGRARKSDAWARSQFETAERMREALNGRPAAERTRQQYQKVINAYRRIYFGSPTSSKADPSVVAVAELQVEMGRRFEDDAILRAAIQQYEFLRKEYPGSKYRVDALFTVGEIYKDDLNDRAKARSTFEEFLKRYPHSHLADEARAALAEPVQQVAAKARAKDKKQAKASANAQSADSEKTTPRMPARVATTRRLQVRIRRPLTLTPARLLASPAFVIGPRLTTRESRLTLSRT